MTSSPFGPVVRRLRGAAGAAVRRRLTRRGSRGRVPAALIVGQRDPAALAVIVCMWARPHRIDDVLAQLAAQELDRPLRLIVWNNRRSHRPLVLDSIRRHGAVGSLASVEFVGSPVNVGGMGRFYALRWLRRAGYRGPAMTLDDDQDITPRFTADLLTAWRPRSLVGVWAFVQLTSYWDRRPAQGDEQADYVGTGGAMIDSEIVDDPEFFGGLPDKFFFLEDIWMSFVATRKGWKLRGCATPYTFVEHDTGQYLGMGLLKEEFAAYLAASSPER